MVKYVECLARRVSVRAFVCVLVCVRNNVAYAVCFCLYWLLPVTLYADHLSVSSYLFLHSFVGFLLHFSNCHRALKAI